MQEHGTKEERALAEGEGRSPAAKTKEAQNN